MNVGFVSTRLSGTDGVSLETDKWTQLLHQMGHQVFHCAGELDDDSPGGSEMVPEMHFRHPDAVWVYEHSFGVEEAHPLLHGKIEEMARFLEEKIEEFVRRFRAFGVCFAIDDFGSDYSNLLRTLRLAPNYLKIDGSLIQAMLRDRRSHKMVANIVEYAREFDIKTVAEFVSTPEIFEECKRLEMDYCQGYYFAEPSPQLEM
jgi:EAL domain-containing protein (putative c-di-GMP-specific phosphodiesterase class I)